MKSFFGKSIQATPIALLAVTILVLPAASISAQQREAPTGAVRPSPTGGSVPDEMHKPSVRERQFKVVEMEREAARIRTPEQEKLALSQIAEDYEKLQLTNNKMMSASMRAAVPDYTNIAAATAEIKTRANRMKENLRLAKVEAKKAEKDTDYKKPMDAAGMKAALLLLDGSIMSFIRNPIFKNPGVVDIEQAGKASRDLETIIELSGLLNKDAQRLGKSAAKTN
jgi:hypothetical protein